MATRRRTRAISAIDVVDRVLDKGIVIDAMACVGVLGIDHIVDIDARVVVASIDTYLQYARPISDTDLVARPARKRVNPIEKRLPIGSAPAVPRPRRDRAHKFSKTDKIRARGLGVRLDLR
jgi:hypothetical protein